MMACWLSAPHCVEPQLYGEVGSRCEHFAPFACEVVAHGLVFLAHRRRLDGGESEHEVGVSPVLQQTAVAKKV